VILGREKIHSVEQQLALLSFAGVPLPEGPRLSLPSSSEATARARTRLIEAGIPVASLASGRFAIVAPGAAFESKRWGAQEFASVIDHLDGRWQIASIIIAGPGQEQLGGEVAGLTESNPCIVSGISLSELIAIIGVFGRLFVGNDSGPMHIAAALGCPIVVVFGSSNPDVWHPWTTGAYRVLGGQHGIGDNNVRGSIDTVSIEKVTAAVDDVMQATASCAAS
jgi:ADP-heptose:LPS heptosyltransferase